MNAAPPDRRRLAGYFLGILLPRNTADAATRFLGTAPSPATLAILEQGLAGKEVAAWRMAAVLLASPDFQRR
jgi:hypothetical protein